MDLILTFGPPGTGKTHSDLLFIEDWLKRGNTAMEEVAYVTFMKSAARDGARRFGINDEELKNQWFRTLHSTCFKVLGMTRQQVVTGSWLKRFGDKLGLRIEDEDEEDDTEEYAEAVLRMVSTLQQAKTQPTGSLLKSLYDLSRLCCRNTEQLDRIKLVPHREAFEYTWPGFRPSEYEGFVTAYERQKVADGKMDFVDMLAEVLRSGDSLDMPKWKRAVVDECQDMSPLQLAVMERLYFGRCETVVMSGDDDQAIMGFQGAKAQDFLNYRNYPGVIPNILPQTRRFGPTGVKFAAEIAKRIRVRQEKDVIGLPGRENPIMNVFGLDPKAVHEGDILLHRHVAGCPEIAGRLYAAGVPFWNERSGVNPFKSTKDVRGYLAFRKLTEGNDIDADSLQYLLEIIRQKSQRDGKALYKHGMGKKIKELPPNAVIGFADLKSFFHEDFIDTIRHKDIKYLERGRYIDYFDKLATNGYDLTKVPKTKIGTIHAFKGREAPRVWLWSEMYPKLQYAGDDEHRVAYVGATRMQHELFIVHESVVGDWTAQYKYPGAESRVLVRDDEQPEIEEF